MEIRKIDAADISLIKPLWEKLKAHHQKQTTNFADYYLQNSFAKRKAELLAKDRLAIFFASSEERNAGFCAVSTTGDISEVDSLYVEPDFRSKGTGTQLMQAGLNWLESFELDAVRLLVGEGNEEAISYYQQLGFKKRATMMQWFK